MSWYFLLILLVIYIGLVIWFIRGWIATPISTNSNIHGSNLPFLSVIVPCRNESESITKLLESINSQHLSTNHFEVIVVDDHSNDQTFEIAKAHKSLNYTPIVIKANENQIGKKQALKAGIDISKGDIVVCTDADCIVGEHWLESILLAFSSSDLQLLTGPVMFMEQKGFWYELMQLEFLSLIGIGAASIRNGSPNMCNGANIAYRKTAFYEVNGFDDNAHIASGDDEFLMHKIVRKYPKGVSFNKNPDAIVYTKSPQSTNEFINQRIRWGSKAAHYSGIAFKWLPAFMYGFNFLLFVSPIFLFLGMNWKVLAIMWLGKLGIEIVFFSVILPFFKSSKILDLVIPAQLFHVVYITCIGVLSLFNKYTWKGR